MEGDAETSPKPESPKTPGRGRKRKTTTDSAENTPQQTEARKRLRPRRSRDISFPKTLEGFEYKFNDDGEFIHMESGDKFDFNALEDEESNQKRFEALAEVIAEHVYGLLESECELEKQTFPVEPKKSDVEGFIFTSSDALTNEDKLLILVHGTETARAGQWSTKVIVEEGLNAGSQIPYIKKAKELGYGILLLNSNQNSILNKFNSPKSIRGNENPEKHSDYIWKNFVRDAKAKHIAIIAYSQGGNCVLKMAHLNAEDFQKRVFAVALADSTHAMTKSSLNKQSKTHLVKIGKNFVPSDEHEVGDEVAGGRAVDIPMESAGDIESSMICSKCMDSIFDFLSSQYDAAQTVEESPKPKKSPKKKKSRGAQQEEEEEEEKKVEEVEEKKEEEESVKDEEKKEETVEEEEENVEEAAEKDTKLEDKEDEKEEEDEDQDDISEKDDKETETEKKEEIESKEEDIAESPEEEKVVAENDSKEEEEEEEEETKEELTEDKEVKKPENEQNSEEKMEVDEVETKEESPKEEEKEKTVNGTEVEIDDGEKMNEDVKDEKMEVEGATKIQEHQEIKTVTTAEPQSVREDV